MLSLSPSSCALWPSHTALLASLLITSLHYLYPQQTGDEQRGEILVETRVQQKVSFPGIQLCVECTENNMLKIAKCSFPLKIPLSRTLPSLSNSFLLWQEIPLPMTLIVSFLLCRLDSVVWVCATQQETVYSASMLISEPLMKLTVQQVDYLYSPIKFIVIRTGHYM